MHLVVVVCGAGIGRARHTSDNVRRQLRKMSVLRRRFLSQQKFAMRSRGRRIGVRQAIAAMILRHSNDRVTRKHHIKPPSIEAVAAMQRFGPRVPVTLLATTSSSGFAKWP